MIIFSYFYRISKRKSFHHNFLTKKSDFNQLKMQNIIIFLAIALALVNISESVHLDRKKLAEWYQTEATDLSELTSFDLTSRDIDSIEVGNFSGLSNLKWISLKNNQLGSIEPGTFTDLSNLVSLDLSANKLSSLGASTFSGLESLGWLY